GLVLGLLVALLPALFYTAKNFIQESVGPWTQIKEINTTEFYAYTPNGLMRQTIPLDEPVLSQAALTSWVSQAVTETMTFDHQNYRERLQQSSRHFTIWGWDKLTHYLQDDHILKRGVPQYTKITAKPASAPVFRESGVIDSRYKVTIALPVTLTLEGGAKPEHKDVVYIITLSRTSNFNASSDMLIENWAVE
ncbi:MAG: DotI/IcmL/TraM family protein, partial [Pseudomonadota bacterium]